ncbi:MAG: hypothetical protein WD844_14310 [Thermoleophilaceae bacterium]
MLLLAIFMATAMTRATVGLDVSSRDVAAKRAVQTAKSGLEVAIYRANGLGLDLNQLLQPTQQCLLSSVSGALGVEGLPGGANWCAAVTEDLGTGAGFSYRVSSVVPSLNVVQTLLTRTTSYLLRRRIVSTGTVDGVTRRVYAEYTTDGQTNETRICVLVCLPHILQGGFLQLYRMDPGTFRECAPTPPTPSDPASGC